MPDHDRPRGPSSAMLCGSIAGTMVATPTGERQLAELAPGDRVFTRDNGAQRLRRTELLALDAGSGLRAIHLRAGALGRNVPDREVVLAPGQRVLVHHPRLTGPFDEPEALLPAQALLGLAGVSRMPASAICFYRPVFERDEVILVNGAWVETPRGAQPAAMAGDRGRARAV